MDAEQTDTGGVTSNGTRKRYIDMTTANRSRKFKAQMADRGLVQCNIWVPASAMAEFKRAAELARDNPDLTVARLVDTRTGKLRGLK